MDGSKCIINVNLTFYMVGISDIQKLLSNISPKLRNEEYVFLTFNEDVPTELTSNSICSFREEEGITLILEKSIADENKFTYEAVWSMITLDIHSDLEAVGFLAAISAKLAEAGISVNCVSAYYHDHLFVTIDNKDEAMKVIESI